MHHTAAPTSFRSLKGDEYAGAYMMDEHLVHDHRKVRINRMQTQLVGPMIQALPPGGMVADVPCGNGRMTQLVQRNDLQVVAMDFNDSMLRAMTQRSQDCHLSRRMRGDITHLPLADKSVDLFINMRLLHHIPDQATRIAMYGQIARVTRGQIVTTFWSTHCWRHVRKKMLGKKIRGCPISPACFRAACNKAGLTVQRILPAKWCYEEECVAICRAT